MVEGSMKTMSWSRYHALSWSFTRIRGKLRGAKRAHRTGYAASGTGIDAAAGEGGSFRHRPAQGWSARAFRALITIIRTGVLPVDTDI
jgi:hypothetical protein